MFVKQRLWHWQVFHFNAYIYILSLSIDTNHVWEHLEWTLPAPKCSHPELLLQVEQLSLCFRVRISALRAAHKWLHSIGISILTAAVSVSYHDLNWSMKCDRAFHFKSQFKTATLHFNHLVLKRLVMNASPIEWLLTKLSPTSQRKPGLRCNCVLQFGESEDMSLCLLCRIGPIKHRKHR